MTNEKLSTIKEQVEELLENEAFVSEMQQAQNAAELHEVLTGYQVDITLEEVEAMAQAGEQAMAQEGELDMEALESVMGGVKWGKLLLGTASFAGYFGITLVGGIVMAVPGGQGAGIFGLTVGGIGMTGSLIGIDQAIHNR